MSELQTPLTKPASPLRDTILGTLVVMLVALAFALVLSVRNVLITIFLGLLLATALRPLMSRLREGRAPSFLAASISVLLLIGVVVGFVVLIAPLLLTQIQEIVVALPDFYSSIREQLIMGNLRILRILGERMPSELPPLGELDTQEVVAQVMTMLPTAGYALFVTIGTLIFTYYWLLYRERSVRGLLLIMPMDRRERAEEIWLRIESRIGAFLRGQMLLSLITGVLSLIGYLLIGLPYPHLLALIAGLLEFIPFLGPVLATLVAAILGFSVSPELGFSALVVGVIIQQVENVFLAPRIMDKAVGISPVVTLLAFVGFAALFGPVGGLLAIPLAAALQVFFAAWIERRNPSVGEVPQGRSLADRLHYEIRILAHDIATHLRQKEAAADSDADVAEEALEQLLADLDVVVLGQNPTIPEEQRSPNPISPLP